MPPSPPWLRHSKAAAPTRVDVDVVDAEVEVGCGDGAHAPVGLGPKGCLLVGRGGGDDEVIAVDVGGLGGQRRHLAALPRLLLNLRNLLALLAGRRDLGTQDDVTDLALQVGGRVGQVGRWVMGKTPQRRTARLATGAAQGSMVGGLPSSQLCYTKLQLPPATSNTAAARLQSPAPASAPPR